MPVLVVGQLQTPPGSSMSALSTASPTISMRSTSRPGKILWQKHWDYPPPTPPRRRRRRNQPQDPAHLGFLRPGGSSDTPVIGPADAQGRRPIYFVTGDGMLHIAERRDRRRISSRAFMFHTGKGWALNLVGNTLWMANTYAGASPVRRAPRRSRGIR